MPIKQRESIIINGTSYFKDDPRLAIDHITKEYIVKDNANHLGLVLNISNMTGSVKVVKWAYTMVHIDKTNSYYLRAVDMNYILVKDYVTVPADAKLYPSIRDGEEDYVLFDYVLHKKLNRPNQYRVFDNLVRSFKDIDNPNLPDEDRKYLLERDIEFGVRTVTNKIFEGLNYTFGIELETSSGRITEEEVEGLNLKCEFDGSLRETPDQKKEDVLGGEYVTGVLRGDSGMKQLNKICSILSKKCTISNKCGVHVHVGNLIFTKENIVYMYILGKLIENDIFSIMPRSRRNNSYCRKLTELKLRSRELNKSIPISYEIQIDEYFNLVFREVSSGKNPSKQCNKLTNHPHGSKCGYDKSTQRYCWLNFVTAMFNTKGSKSAYTLEFRIHYATLNYTKIKNWLKICVAFVNFAENHQASIRRGYWLNKSGDKFPIDLYTIIKASYPRSGKLIEEYIEERKNRFLLDTGDIEALEYNNDKEGMVDLNLKECVL